MENRKIKIGMPQALLYHKYRVFWETFWQKLGCEVVVSPDTNREIMSKGVSLAVDESCLSVKIYLGHVDYLRERVDYIFIPRVISLHAGEESCVKFMALNDIVRNTFPGIKILEYTVEKKKLKYNLAGMLKVAWQLKINPLKAIVAYLAARQKYWQAVRRRIAEQQAKVNAPKLKPRILIVSHPYTTYDGFLGKSIIKFLESLEVELIYSDIIDSGQARALSKNISQDLYWTYNKEFLGAIELYKDTVDGIIFLMVFPCGPDSLVINLCQNKLTNVPLTVITLDELQGEAGLKTRLESFVDILKLKIKRNGQKNS